MAKLGEVLSCLLYTSCSLAASEEAAMSSEDAAEEAAPEELMPSVCWSQLEKLLPRIDVYKRQLLTN